MCEMNCICESYQHNSSDDEDEKKKKVLEKVKVVTPVALHKVLRSKYSILKQERSRLQTVHFGDVRSNRRTSRSTSRRLEVGHIYRVVR